jgi:hypothetical protein
MSNICREIERLTEAVSAQLPAADGEPLMSDVERAVAVLTILQRHRVRFPDGADPAELVAEMSQQFFGRVGGAAIGNAIGGPLGDFVGAQAAGSRMTGIRLCRGSTSLASVLRTGAGCTD